MKSMKKIVSKTKMKMVIMPLLKLQVKKVVQAETLNIKNTNQLMVGE
jgi:hypothetical protein